MDDLVLEQLKAIRRDMATKDDLRDMATKDDLRDVATKDDLAPLTTKVELEGLRSEMLRHFVEVETRVTTEVHELISLLRELVTSRDRLAARVSQLEQDVQDLKRKAG